MRDCGKRNRIPGVFIAALAGAIVLTAALPIGRAQENMEPPRVYAIGDTVKDFQGDALDGKRIDLEDYRGKFVFLSFWAAWYNIWGWRVYTPIIFEWILRLRM